MKNISLSSVLLFALSVFFVMQYRLSPGDTPYGLFGFIFLLLITNFFLDLVTLPERLYTVCKNTLLAVLVLVVLGCAFTSAIVVRHNAAPVYGVHDIILQQEAAIRYFVHGKNPYQETYFGTPLQEWHYSDTEVNPALYHFVMEPFYLLSALPFYSLSNHLLGYFDGRIPLFVLFGVLLLVAFFVPKVQEDKRVFVTLLAFNPAMLGYTLEGRSDMYMFAFIFLGLVLLQQKKYGWAGVPIALAFLVKQSIWPFFPLYVAYLLFVFFKEQGIGKAVKTTLLNLLPFALTFLAFFLPFYAWNSRAFLESTIFYLVGNDPHSYPISGYGFGMLLHQMGIIKDVHAYYPFQLWQVGVGLPILSVLLFWLYRKPTVAKLIFSYGIFLFVFWYFSRYFNNSHVGYLSMVFLTAYFWPQHKINH